MNTSSGPSHQGFFAEYSLWNDSTYSSVSLPPIQFTRPVFEESIFLTPPSVEQSAVNKNVERDKQETKSGNPWFESYLKKSLRVVKRDDLYKDPELFYEEDEGFLDPVVKAVHCLSVNREESNSEEVPTTSQSRPRGRQTNTRGRKNLMQRRLEKALAQPAQIERGASMMQRMGWEGGGLGRAGDGIVDPIAPNALYARNAIGLGSASPEMEPDPVPTPPKRPKPTITAKAMKANYKTNILLNILEFVKNDLQIELCFDEELKNGERKKIHQVIAALNGDEEEDPKKQEEFESMKQFDIVREIHLRNAYLLGTQSDGTPPNRQICIYKEAPGYMYLVTPDDIRNQNEEEESNPFLRSITKHMKTEPNQTTTLFDKLISYFIEFATEEYTEFRFLGPFVMEEITVMNTFLGLISCLAKNEPDVKGPDELLKIFEKGTKFSVDEDVNGYVAIKKLPTEMET